MAKDNRVNIQNSDALEHKTKFSVDAVKQFSVEVRNEFHKIAWPDKKHTMASTGVVVVLVMIISFYLASIDLVIGKLIGSVLQ